MSKINVGDRVKLVSGWNFSFTDYKVIKIKGHKALLRPITEKEDPHSQKITQTSPDKEVDISDCVKMG